MSSESEPIESQRQPVHDGDPSGRHRFGLILTIALGLIAALVSIIGTRDAWVTLERRAEAKVEAASGLAADPAWDVELPAGPHRAEFQTSCLICHSARLPLGQPSFPREKWAEIVHKMVAVHGAPMTPENEAQVVEYMIAARPPGS